VNLLEPLLPAASGQADGAKTTKPKTEAPTAPEAGTPSPSGTQSGLPALLSLLGGGAS
jgi:hypothetical protein